MKIKQLKIAGFRGFNVEKTIDFHDKITIIAASNSHGKTSISEAMEFLTYGATSKVENADSKEEYRDSYRNRHFPSDKFSYIEAVFEIEKDKNLHLRLELDPDGITIRRFLNGTSVTGWPFQEELAKAARPFVLQHALKYLLLVAPSERFKGFARLLGLEEVDNVFRAIISLCTKPNVNIQPEGRRILNELTSLEERIKEVPALKKILSSFKQGVSGIDEAYKIIESYAESILKTKLKPEEKLAQLIALRTANASKIYSGEVGIRHLTEGETQQLSINTEILSSTIDALLIEDYGRLCIEGVTERLKNEATLLKLGIDALKDSPQFCPLCTQKLDPELIKSIHARHAAVAVGIQKENERSQSYSRVNLALDKIKDALQKHEKIHSSQVSDLIISMEPKNEQKVVGLLGGPTGASVEIVKSAAATARIIFAQLQNATSKVRSILLKCATDLKKNLCNSSDIENVGIALQSYLSEAEIFSKKIVQLEMSLIGPAKLFHQAIDVLAGTSSISLTIELFEKKPNIKRALRVRDVVAEGLKELKKNAEQTLAEMVETSMNTDLTAAVMAWYSKIKTVGDPDVHFSGFAMDRTKSGDFKSRRLSVKAKSYGVELPSAVSSLSESKLNALGLCVSIASAIRTPGPWSFLIIDDPIQSWDDEHETQFIDVLRSLVETEQKQIIVLTHKKTWAKQVSEGCRTLNGFRYEITGYTKEGPHIVMLDWTLLDERLREIDIIANNPDATSVQMQHAEEEIRLAICEFTASLAKRKLGRLTSPHNINKKDARDILTAAGLESKSTDNITAMFVNADDAHHAPKTYEPNSQRIRHALASLKEAAKLIKDKRE